MAMRSLLIVGDSNQKFIHENVLYSELSVDKVVTGSVDPKNRGYCSERSWINAKFPEKNLEEQVPKLLEQTNFNLLVIQSPTNDISNLKGEKHAKLLAKKSSTTTLRIAKESLDSFKSLEKVIVMPRPPRCDTEQLQTLNDYSNSCLYSQSLDKRITIGTMEAFENKKVEDIFGEKRNKPDYIHLKGKLGAVAYNMAIIQSVHKALASDIENFVTSL